jgi:hypothetical protein
LQASEKAKPETRSPKTMMHNPFQSYQTDPTLGAYAGNPYTPFTAMQSATMNPALNPLAAIQGLSSCATAGGPQIGQQGYAGVPTFVGLHPQQLTAYQNPWIPTGLQNPWFTAALQNALLNPILAQQLIPTAGSPFGLQPLTPYGQQILGQVSPFAQQGLPFTQQGLPFAQQGLPYGQQGVPYPQQGSPYGQPPFGQVSPFAQQGLPYGQLGSPLAPQTWVGQAGPFGNPQAFGQIHPLLAQLGARQFHTPGISPWAGF